MSTPCNSLNVQLIKVSSLASYTSLKDNDLLMIVQNDGVSTKFSRQSELTSFKSYILKNGIGDFPATSYTTNLDTNILGYYISGNNSFTFTHGLGSKPSLVRTVLYCNTTDGLFLSGSELEIFNCFNNNSKPICSINVSSTTIKIVFPVFTSVTTYSSGSPASEVNLTLANWNLKVYVWK